MPAPTWYNNIWPYRFKITPSAVNGDLYYDFSLAPSSFWDHVRSDGGDIRVTKEDGTTEVAREISGFDSIGKKGSLYLATGGGTAFYIYYGNPDATEPAANSTYGSQAVWGANPTYHFDELSGTDAFDSSSSAKTASFTDVEQNNIVQLQEGNGRCLDFQGQVRVVEQLTGSTAIAVGKVTNYSKVDQSFVYSTYSKMNAIRLKRIPVTGTPTGSIIAAIYADSGGSPTGSALASNTLNLTNWNNLSTNGGWLVMSLIGLTPGNTYHLVLQVSTGASDTNFFNVAYNPSGTYGTLKQFNGSTWSVVTGTLYFSVEYAGYLSLASANSLPYDGFSVAWRMRRNTNDYECIFSDGSGGSGQIEVSNNNLRFETMTNNVWQSGSITTGITVADNAWHDYVMVSTPTNFYVYTDGALTFTKGSAIGDIVAQRYRYFGRRQTSPNATYGLSFNGQLDEARFVSSVYDATYIANLHANLSSPSTFWTTGNIETKSTSTIQRDSGFGIRTTSITSKLSSFGIGRTEQVQKGSSFGIKRTMQLTHDAGLAILRLFQIVKDSAFTIGRSSSVQKSSSFAVLNTDRVTKFSGFAIKRYPFKQRANPLSARSGIFTPKNRIINPLPPFDENN